MHNVATPQSSIVARTLALGPGVLATLVVSTGAIAGGRLEEFTFGRPVIEPLVLAILIGMAVRTAVGPRPRVEPGVRFAAKDVLEVAVFLLGATMDVPRLFSSGPSLAIGIVILVCSALGVGFVVGRSAGLSPRLATLVACGNAICGNSAIAAVAPVIGAEREEVAASIALTAVLGVGVVLGLPFLIKPLGYSNYQYGVLAGLTVYAVPQVLAAAFAVSPLSGQVATVVKLARVLMLGPVVVFFALRAPRRGQGRRAIDREDRSVVRGWIRRPGGGTIRGCDHGSCCGSGQVGRELVDHWRHGRGWVLRGGRPLGYTGGRAGRGGGVRVARHTDRARHRVDQAARASLASWLIAAFLVAVGLFHGATCAPSSAAPARSPPRRIVLRHRLLARSARPSRPDALAGHAVRRVRRHLLRLTLRVGAHCGHGGRIPSIRQSY